MEFWLTTLVLGVLFGFNLYTNYFHHKWWAFSILVAGLLCFNISQNSNALIGLFYFYCLCSSAYVSIFTLNRHYAHPKKGLNINLSFATAKSHIAMLGMGLVFILMDGEKTKLLLEVNKALLLINVILTFLPKKWVSFETEMGGGRKAPITGFSANTSVNGTLLSLQGSLVLFGFEQNPESSLVLLVLSVLAVLKCRGSIGVGAILISLIIYSAFYYNFTREYFIAMFALLTIFVFIADFFMRRSCPKTNIFTISGRGDIWKYSRDLLWPNTNKIFGSGIGSYQYLMPTAQEQSRSHGDNMNGLATYAWSHGEWVQLIIEGGLVGTVLYFFAFFSVIWVCFQTHNWAGLSFVGCYLVNSLFNFPHHLVPESFLIILGLRVIMEGCIPSF